MKSLFLFFSLIAWTLFPPGGWLEKASLHFEAGQYQEALQAYRQALQAYPAESAPIFYNMAQCYLALDSTQRALETLQQAMSPSQPALSARVYNQIGVLLVQDQQQEQALRYFRKALIADPTHEDAAFNYELLSRLMARDKPPKEGSGDPDEDKAPEDAPPGSEAEDAPPPDEVDQPPREDEPRDDAQRQQVQAWQRPLTDDRPLNQPQDQISMEEARRILEGMRENELRFLQQLRKMPVSAKKEPGKPDW